MADCTIRVKMILAGELIPDDIEDYGICIMREDGGLWHWEDLTAIDEDEKTIKPERAYKDFLAVQINEIAVADWWDESLWSYNLSEIGLADMLDSIGCLVGDLMRLWYERGNDEISATMIWEDESEYAEGYWISSYKVFAGLEFDTDNKQPETGRKDGKGHGNKN